MITFYCSSLEKKISNLHTQRYVIIHGCTLDLGLTMSMHKTRVCKAVNYYLHCKQNIRNCKLLVHRTYPCYDCDNALLYGARQVDRVQRQAADPCTYPVISYLASYLQAANHLIFPTY